MEYTSPIVNRKFLRSSTIFRLGLIGWLSGLAWPVFEFSQLLIYLLVFLLALSFIIQWNRFIVTLCLTLGLFIGSSSYENWYLAKIVPMVSYNTQQTIKLTVYSKATKFNNQARYLAKTSNGWYTYLVVPRAEPIKPATQLTVFGAFSPVGKEEDPTYRLALAKQHIFAKISFPEIIQSEPASLNFSQKILNDTHYFFDSVIHRLFTEPRAALFAGILTGTKTDLPESILMDFKVAGLTHIVAVSGYNITIILNLLAIFTRRFGRYNHLFLTIVAVACFVVFTGASASVVRAGILASLFSVSYFLGRKASIIPLLFLTATLMTFANPLIVRYDIGFQLSFAAVIGLALFAQPIKIGLERVRIPTLAAELLSSTTAAQITTAPVIAYYFGSLSVYSVLANLLAGPIVTIVTAGGIPLVLAANLLYPIIYPISLLFNVLLQFLIGLSSLVSHLPLANATLPKLPIIVVLLYYLVILTPFWFRPSKR